MSSFSSQTPSNSAAPPPERPNINKNINPSQNMNKYLPKPKRSTPVTRVHRGHHHHHTQSRRNHRSTSLSPTRASRKHHPPSNDSHIRPPKPHATKPKPAKQQVHNPSNNYPFIPPNIDLDTSLSQTNIPRSFSTPQIRPHSSHLPRKYPPTSPSHLPDPITLNIGGIKFCTSLSALTEHKTSVLSHMAAFSLVAIDTNTCTVHIAPYRALHKKSTTKQQRKNGLFFLWFSGKVLLSPARPQR